MKISFSSLFLLIIFQFELFTVPPIIKFFHNGTIANDIRTNQEYELQIEFTGEASKTLLGKKLFARIYYFFDNDHRILPGNFFTQQMEIKNSSNDFALFSTKFAIKPNFTSFSIALFDSTLFLGYSWQFFILTSSDTIPENGYQILINSAASPEQFDTLFFEYSTYYPNSLAKFLIKWKKLLELRKITKETIRKGMEEIKLLDVSQSDKIFALFIGTILLKDTLLLDSMTNLLNNCSDINLLNNEYISSFFDSFFDENSPYADRLHQLKFEIIKNNPLSLYTSHNLYNGFLVRKYYENALECMEIIKSRLNYYHFFDDKLAYAELIQSSKTYVDLIDSGIAICNELVHSLEDTNYTYNNLDDPFNHLFFQSRIFWEVFAHLYLKKKDFQNAINILRKAKVFFPPFDSFQSQIQFLLGYCYHQQGQSDSAVYNLLHALKVDPTNKLAVKELKKIANLKKIPNFDDWLSEELTKFQFTKIRLNKKSPKAVIGTEKIDLNNPTFPLLLEFFRLNCPFCLKNLEKLSKLGKENKIRILIISNESKEAIRKIFASKKWNFEIIDNGNELISFFNIHFYPETIIISEKGEILKKITGEIKEETVLSVD